MQQHLTIEELENLPSLTVVWILTMENVVAQYPVAGDDRIHGMHVPSVEIHPFYVMDDMLQSCDMRETRIWVYNLEEVRMAERHDGSIVKRYCFLHAVDALLQLSELMTDQWSKFFTRDFRSDEVRLLSAAPPT